MERNYCTGLKPKGKRKDKVRHRRSEMYAKFMHEKAWHIVDRRRGITVYTLCGRVLTKRVIESEIGGKLCMKCSVDFLPEE